MRDPHVQALFYLISSDETISYKDPHPLHFSNDLGRFDLSDGRLTISPYEHFPDESAAKQAMQHFIKSWEIEADITKNIGTIRFQFERSEIIDRNPPKPGETGEQVFLAGSISHKAKVSMTATLTLVHSKYPDPPLAFASNPEVEMGYHRWVRFKDGKESLQSMSYFVLTILQVMANGRAQVSRKFKIAPSILNKIGELSSTKGDKHTARKAGAAMESLTPSEEQWLEKASRMLIHRIGQYEAGKPLYQINMTDLPQI